MTLRDLEYFIVIAREKSITRAATSLYVAQPALSQCIQKLEKEIGVQLFARSSIGVLLTSEGRCFLEFAQAVLNERVSLEKKLKDVKDAASGIIRLGFTGSQATYVLPYILPEFQKQHPGITITLVEGSSDSIEQKLLHRDVDIGILHAPVLRNELTHFELSIDDMVVVPRLSSSYRDYLYTSESDERTFIDLRFFLTEPLAMTLPSQRSRMVCDQILTNAGIVPHILQTCQNIATLDALAQVDYASAILPRKQLSSTLLSHHTFFYPDPSVSVPYTFNVATLKGEYIPIAARSLLDWFYKKRYSF